MSTNAASVDENFQNADAVQKLDAEDCSDDEMESEKQRLQMIEHSPIINVRRDMTSVVYFAQNTC